MKLLTFTFHGYCHVNINPYFSEIKNSFGNNRQQESQNAHLRQKIFKSSLFSLLYHVYVQQATPGRSNSEGYSFKMYEFYNI